LQAFQLTDIIITNQLIYLVAHHFTGLTTTFLRRRSMKPVKNFVFAVLLLSFFAFNTVAGDIQTPGVAAPQPSPTPTHAMSTIGGTAIPCTNDDPYCEQSGETSDYLLVEALTALLSLY
jgi:hypothetical protein